MSDSLEDKFCGCLLGLGLGDSLGAPFEGWWPEQVKRRVKTPADLVKLRLEEVWAYTDDTALTLCHTQSLISQSRVDPADIAHRFVKAFEQGLIRGIGMTCLKAIRSLHQGISWQQSGQSGEYTAGNGSAMRIAPIGLFDHRRLEKLPEDCRVATIITHRHEEAIAGSRAVAFAVSRLVENAKPDAGFVDEICDFVGPSKVTQNLQKAKRLLSSNTKADEALSILGTSGYVVETVASALYCFLTAEDSFTEAVLSAIRGGVDTDTTAAITGALSGACLGESAFPPEWVEKLENQEEIRRLAQKLYHLTAK